MAKKKPSTYDLPTDDKVAFGARMRHAREVAGLSQEESAATLGYAQQVQLSLMESGQRMPPLRVVIAAARLYGTTTDYLCGLSTDVDRDPAVAVQRHVAAAIVSDVRALLAGTTALAVQTARDLRPSAATTLRLAEGVLEANRALDDVRRRSRFDDDAPGGAKLVAVLDSLAGLALEAIAAAQRAQRVLAPRPVMLDVAGLPSVCDLGPLPSLPAADEDGADADADAEDGVNEPFADAEFTR